LRPRLYAYARSAGFVTPVSQAELFEAKLLQSAIS